MSKEFLIASYETKRLLILNTFLNHPKKIDPALAFAYHHRMAPILHEEIAREHYGLDPYADIYAVKADFVGEVAKYLDEQWLAEDLDSIAFSKLEDKFGGYKANRIELISSIQYLFLDHRFDDKLYEAVKKNAPLEAHGIMDAYTADDVSFE